MKLLCFCVVLVRLKMVLTLPAQQFKPGIPITPTVNQIPGQANGIIGESSSSKATASVSISQPAVPQTVATQYSNSPSQSFNSFATRTSILSAVTSAPQIQYYQPQTYQSYRPQTPVQTYVQPAQPQVVTYQQPQPVVYQRPQQMVYYQQQPQQPPQYSQYPQYYQQPQYSSGQQPYSYSTGRPSYSLSDALFGGGSGGGSSSLSRPVSSALGAAGSLGALGAIGTLGALGTLGAGALLFG
ncbi:uncharacterized protein LOC120418529 isoform X1 [Culex pipiens pallens]|uniref:uncharacterized protein LOC120418529 isoform X1 n=1 Tax=Culex pipiens pallens TaxID=42434 RepID=UPI0022AAB954|nr:uncharacterized protein LOC120418529 isoform X1 [Culex pipiens pallens]